MSLRTRLALLSTVSIAVCVGLVTWIATVRMRRAFEATDAQHTAALVAQFRKEFSRRAQQIITTLDGIGGRDSAMRIALEANRAQPDYSSFVNEASSLAASHHLDFFEFLTRDGAIISSAQWPARFGYREDWIAQRHDWRSQAPFLRFEELPDGPALALVAVRPVLAGESMVYVAGGIRLNRSFLSSLTLPDGMRALLYTNASSGSSPIVEDAAGPITDADALGPFIRKLQSEPAERSEVVRWPHSGSETVQAFPLRGVSNELLAVLFIASSRHDLLDLEIRLRKTAFLVGGIGMMVGLILSLWTAAHITRPVEQLAVAASGVAAGDWGTQVDVGSRDEIGQLAEAFNQMTRNLVEQRDRVVQAERVAAWRELARRLAHELKNPLFPLQITIENLIRAREQNAEQFDEVFRESTATLLAELTNLKGIIGRFSDFAKMPAPQLQLVDVNETVLQALNLHKAQLSAPGKPAVKAQVELIADPSMVNADSDLLHKAISNLILNAMDAMPNGGTLTLRTSNQEHSLRIEVSDTGTGLTREECERLFTPYYTTKHHGTGLGLAIVQSVIADHHGKISVGSEPSRGTTFRIDLPLLEADELVRGANA